MKRNGNIEIEFNNYSNLDDSIIDAEEYSNFRILGIGKPTQKQLEREAKRKIAKEERKGKKLGGRVLNIFAKFNPAAALVRAGTLAGIRLNIFGIALKLYPALLSEEELKARNFDLDNAKNAKKALEKVHKFYFGLGGRSLSFDNAVKKGYDKPIFNTKKMKAMKAQEKSSFTSFNRDDMNTQTWAVYNVTKPPYRYSRTQGKGNGIEFEPTSNFDYDEYYANAAGGDDAALITAGIGALGAIAGMIAAIVKKNPYKQGTPQEQQAQIIVIQAEKQGDLASPPVNPQEQQRLMEQAKDDVVKGGDPNDESSDSENGGEEKKILGMSKPIFWTVTGIVAAAAIGFTIWKLKKKK